MGNRCCKCFERCTRDHTQGPDVVHASRPLIPPDGLTRVPDLVRAFSDGTLRAQRDSLEMQTHLCRLKSEAELAHHMPRPLGEDLLALLENHDSADMVLRCNGESAPCHRAIMWARVPTLRQAISDLSEDKTCGTEVALQGNLTKFLQDVYSGRHSSDSSDSCSLGVSLGADALASLRLQSPPRTRPPPTPPPQPPPPRRLRASSTRQSHNSC